MESEKGPQSSREHRGVTYLLLSFVAFGVGLFLSRKNSPHENSAESIGPYNHTDYEYNGPNTKLNTISNPPPTPPSHNHSNWGKDNTPGWKKVVEICVGLGTVGLLIVNIFLLCSAKKSADAAEQQTKLLRQQLVGIQGAIIALAAPGWSTDDNVIHFIFQNLHTGKVAGSVVDLSVTFQREYLPDRKLIGDPWIVPHRSKEPIDTNSQWTFDYPLSYKLPKASVALWPGKEGLSVEVHYTTDNGFGDTLARDDCFDWLPQLSLKSPTDNSTTSVGGFVGGPCPHDMNRIDSQITRFKEALAKGYTPQQ